jgi:hypothetical protein
VRGEPQGARRTTGERGHRGAGAGPPANEAAGTGEPPGGARATRGARGRGRGRWGGRATGAGPPGRGVRRGRGRRGGASNGVGSPGGRDGGRGLPGRGAQWEQGHRGEAMGGGKRERERGAHLRDPNSGDHRLQDLGHHGGRERGGRGGCCAGELNEGKRPGEGARMGRARAPGARGPSWAGPHRGSKPTTRTTIDRNSIREAKSEMKLSHTRD